MGAVKARYKFGDTVRVASDNDNEGYNSFRNDVLVVTSVATGVHQHPGYDEGVGQALYDLKKVNGKPVDYSLYEYELEDA